MNIPFSVKTIAQRGLLLGKKFTPEIMVGAGVVGVVTAAVMASKATLKLETTVDRIKYNIDTAKQVALANEEDPKKELTRVYVRGTMDIVKLYGPSVTLGTASIMAILGGHGILRRRNIAVAAAYKVLEESHAEYRRRVVEEYGEEKDLEIRRGMQTEKIKDEETGKTKSVTRFDPNALSEYAKIFDENNPNWEKVPDLNLHFLKMVQIHMNQKLQTRGHLFLNEAYDALGIPRTQAGQVVGWVRDGKGDDFVDFGIYEPRNAIAVNHTTSRADSVFLLDFNVAGVVWDLI